ncbi:MAG TPA: hypothetical protein PK916_16160 [Bacteroidota bacterium]|nr:hypothetical protein [Bacteroidota bacterium]
MTISIDGKLRNPRTNSPIKLKDTADTSMYRIPGPNDIPVNARIEEI